MHPVPKQPEPSRAFLHEVAGWFRQSKRGKPYPSENSPMVRELAKYCQQVRAYHDMHEPMDMQWTDRRIRILAALAAITADLPDEIAAWCRIRSNLEAGGGKLLDSNGNVAALNDLFAQAQRARAFLESWYVPKQGRKREWESTASSIRFFATRAWQEAGRAAHLGNYATGPLVSIIRCALGYCGYEVLSASIQKWAEETPLGKPRKK